jgi:hypothetical protein
VINTIVYDFPIDCGPENHFQYSAASLCTIEQAHIEIQWHITTFKDNIYNSFHAVFSRLNSLLTKIDTVVNENNMLCIAYDASQVEAVALKTAVDTLSHQISDHITIPAPPLLDLMASSTTMEEMMMQLSVIQHDIQDVLEAVHNPPSKRKRCTSSQDAEPIMLTN